MKSGAPRGERSSAKGLTRVASQAATWLSASGSRSLWREGFQRALPSQVLPLSISRDPEQSRQEEPPPGLQAELRIQLQPEGDARPRDSPPTLGLTRSYLLESPPGRWTPPFTSVCVVVQSSSPIKAVTLPPLEPRSRPPLSLPPRASGRLPPP